MKRLFIAVVLLTAGLATGFLLGTTVRHVPGKQATLSLKNAGSYFRTPCYLREKPSGREVAMFQTPVGYSDGGGWVAWSDGCVDTASGPGYYGDLPAIRVVINDVMGMLPTTDAKGYWLLGADGGVFAFGDAKYLGSLPGRHIHMQTPVVGMSYCTHGSGYVIQTADGEYQSFGCQPG